MGSVLYVYVSPRADRIITRNLKHFWWVVLCERRLLQLANISLAPYMLANSGRVPHRRSKKTSSHIDIVYGVGAFA